MKSLITSILGLAIFALTLPVSAGTLDDELDYKVRAISEYMKKNSYEQVTLQPIGGIAEATGTNRIGAMVQDKFATHNIKLVGTGAPVQLDIEVSLGPDDATLFIDLQLKTAKGRKLRDWSGEFEYEVNDKKVYVEVDKGTTTAEVDYAEDVQKILSIPYAEHKLPIDPHVANKTKLKKLAHAYDHPVTNVYDTTKVSTHKSGLYQMEVVVTKDPHMASNSYHPLPPTVHGGYSEVKLHRGDMIGVRLYNNSDERVAVEVCLDGINSFYFSNLKTAKHYVIPPHKSILVRGFHKDYNPTTHLHVYRHFQIVDYSQSAWLHAQQTGFASLPESQGSITAHFAKEALLTRGNPVPESDLIGQGKEFVEKAKVQKMKVGKVIETVVVRYKKPTI